MKAIVNGVALEGTPEEIMEFQILQEEKLKRELMQRLSTNKSSQWSWSMKNLGIYSRTGTR